jgi:hypothetical protein
MKASDIKELVTSEAHVVEATGVADGSIASAIPTLQCLMLAPTPNRV